MIVCEVFEMRLSIVVPMFNAERFIADCIETIHNQGLQQNEYEIIAIDDGSTDSTPQLCDRYAAQLSNFRVYHQRNAGAGAARNRGIDLAKGDYLYFFDVDDGLKEGTLRRLLDQCEEESLDVLYDIDSEIGAEIDLAIEEGLETMMFYHVETNNPAEADEYYFGLYPYVEGMFDGVSDQDMINEQMSYYPSDPEGIYLMYYDDPMIFIGVATDKDGNPGPVYYGEPFTLTRDGVADPEGLKDLFGVASATKAPVNTEFSVVRKNMPAPERFSVRKDVETPVAKVYDEPVVVAPSNVELPDASAAQEVRVVRSFYRK